MKKDSFPRLLFYITRPRLAGRRLFLLQCPFGLVGLDQVFHRGSPCQPRTVFGKPVVQTIGGPGNSRPRRNGEQPPQTDGSIGPSKDGDAGIYLAGGRDALHGGHARGVIYTPVGGVVGVVRTRFTLQIREL
eukprot:scaffold40782_cov191-Amphora_coffeaeformis.AAC.3